MDNNGRELNEAEINEIAREYHNESMEISPDDLGGAVALYSLYKLKVPEAQRGMFAKECFMLVHG